MSVRHSISSIEQAQDDSRGNSSSSLDHDERAGILSNQDKSLAQKSSSIEADTVVTVEGMSDKQESDKNSDPIKGPKKPLRRELILYLISFAGLLSPLSVNIYLPALSVIRDDLQTTDAMLSYSVAGYTLAMGIAPMFWGALGDCYGRRPAYLISFLIYIAGTIGCLLVQDIYTLIVMRFLQACGSSSVLSLGAGTLSDIYLPQERGRAMGTFFLGPLIGPILAPVIGGNLSNALGWRSIFWVLLGFSAFLFICIAFLLPETNAPTKDAKKKFNPFHMLLVLRYKHVAFVILHLCFLFASLYCVTQTISRDFVVVYNMNSAEVGNVFLGYALGSLCGSIVGGRISDRMLTASRAPDGKLISEKRLRAVWIGTAFGTVGLLVHGIALALEAHYMVAVSGDALLGFAQTLTLTTISTYLIDIFPGSSAGISGVHNCLRNLAATVATIVVFPIENAWGPFWLFAGLAITINAGTVLVAAVYRYGYTWRQNVKG